MEGKTFERELPKGYKIATVMDASKGRFAVVLTLISLLFLIVAVAAMALPFVFEPEDIDDLPYLSVSFLLGMVASFVYIVLHELVHGAAYKRLTGEKLTYGFTFTCAYCGVPKIFTYRRTALIAVLAPFVLFSLILIPALVVAYYVSFGLYLALGVLFAMHFSGCSGDVYVAALLLFKYKDARVLMNDTGPKMALLVPCESPSDEDTARIEKLVSEIKSSDKKSR